MTLTLVTDKYTKEQKIKRLQEMLGACKRGSSSTALASAWLNLARNNKQMFMSMYAKSELVDEARATWDVHTGIAFTKLYRALK